MVNLIKDSTIVVYDCTGLFTIDNFSRVVIYEHKLFIKATRDYTYDQICTSHRGTSWILLFKRLIGVAPWVKPRSRNSHDCQFCQKIVCFTSAYIKCWSQNHFYFFLVEKDFECYLRSFNCGTTTATATLSLSVTSRIVSLYYSLACRIPL